MKKVLSVLAVVVLTFSMSAQEESKVVWCPTCGIDLVIDEVDEFNGYTKKKTEFYTIATSEEAIVKAAAYRVENVLALEVYVKPLYSDTPVDLGCAGSFKNYIMFLYEDGRTVKIDKDRSDINCSDGAASMYVMNNIRTRGITKLRLQMSESYLDATSVKTSGSWKSIEHLLEAVD